MGNISKNELAVNRSVEICPVSVLGTRRYQQDFVLTITSQNDAVGVICDGMGGLSGGERASMTAASVFFNEYRTQNPPERILPQFMRDTAVKMDHAVSGLQDEKGKSLKAGTTAIVSVIRGNALYWLSVGDSKIYIIRGSQMQAVTREHNYRLNLGEMLNSGKITREQYLKEEKTPRAEALTSYIGMNGIERIDGNGTPFMLAHGDMILMCSDGLYKSLEDSQILAMIQDNEFDLSIAAERLVDMSVTYRAGSHDNTSVILMRYSEVREDMGGFMA